MTTSAYEIIERGTDHEALVYGSLEYSVDLTSDPHNSIGWVVRDGFRADPCTVTEAAAVPGARDYVLERTRAAIERASERVVEFDYPAEPVEELRRELAEVR